MGCPRYLTVLVVSLLPVLGRTQGILQVPAPPTANILCWQAGRRLVQADFQAKTQPNYPAERLLPGHSLGAMTEANARIYDVTDVAGRSGVVVRVELDRTKSWFSQAPNLMVSSTLAHEQLHFDIVELSGRKLRRLFAEYAAANKPLNGAATTVAIDCIYEEEADLQNLYDEETQFGNDVVQQGRWTGLLHYPLRYLDRYKSSKRDCLQHSTD